MTFRRERAKRCRDCGYAYPLHDYRCTEGGLTERAALWRLRDLAEHKKRSGELINPRDVLAALDEFVGKP